MLQRSMMVEATVYTTNPAENGGYRITCTGHKLRKGICAVDPRFIPLGSTVYLPDYGMTLLADDTGGAIRNRRLDICVQDGPTGRHFMNRWGRRKVRIIISTNTSIHHRKRRVKHRHE